MYQFWLDPIPNNESRIVVERTTPERVSTELIIRMSILLDHLPTNFDVAFSRAMDSLTSPTQDGKVSLEKDKTRRKSMEDRMFESVAEIGLKGTTQKQGGEGQVLDEGHQ